MEVFQDILSAIPEIIRPDATIFPMFILFVLSLIVLNRLIFKPTIGILEERDKQTVGLERQIARFEEHARIKRQEYEALLADAHALARNGRDEILKAADTQQKEIIDEARQEAEKYLEQVQREIAEQTGVAQSRLKEKARELAREISKRLLEKTAA